MAPCSGRFAVEDIEDVVAQLRARGFELIGEVAQYEDRYRLCYVRGPEGIIVALAEERSSSVRNRSRALISVAVAVGPDDPEGQPTAPARSPATTNGLVGGLSLSL
jgi:hypothetical protein